MYKCLTLAYQVLNMGCMDFPIPLSYTDTPRNIHMYMGTWGHTDVWGAFRHTGGIQTYGAYECMRGVYTPLSVHMPLFSYTPIHLDPPYVQRVLIEYLFCYIIKCFPTLEAGMGDCQT